MKKKLLFKLLLLNSFIIVYSCSDENSFSELNSELNNDNFMIEDYHGFYAQYSTSSIFFLPDSDNLVKFEYDQNNRIKKRTGDLIHTGIGSYLSDFISFNVTYNNNNAFFIKNNSNPDFDILDYEYTLTFDVDNKIKKKTIIEETTTTDLIKYDTINYDYSNGKLVYFVKTSNENFTGFSVRHFKESNLYYSNIGNLDSIVSISYVKFSDMANIILETKEKEVFENYDNAKNPFRKLQMFEETFNRSLSKNNFTKYTKFECNYYYPNNNYDLEPIELPMEERYFKTWNLLYDNDGEWIYNQF